MARAKAIEEEVTITTEPVAVERPAEEAAGLALRAAVERFNAGILARTEMTDEDDRMLDDVEAMHAAYQTAARGEWPLHHIPEGVHTLNVLVPNFGKQVRGNVAERITSGDAEWTEEFPRIEYAHHRQRLALQGEELIRVIDDAIAAGYSRIAEAQAVERKLRATTRFWLSRPETRAEILAAIARNDARPDSINAPSALRDLRSAQQTFINAEEREGRPAPAQLFSHDWRKWLPLAQEALAEEAGG